MKLIQVILMMSLMISCSLNSKKNLQQYEIVNNLWQKKSKLNDVTDTFGIPNESSAKKVVYFFPNSKILKIQFTFNSQDQIETAFLFLEKNEIENLKSFINCKWNETIGSKQIVSTTYLTHQGNCLDYPLRFNYFSSLKSYEIWWGKIQK